LNWGERIRAVPPIRRRRNHVAAASREEDVSASAAVQRVDGRDEARHIAVGDRDGLLALRILRSKRANKNRSDQGKPGRPRDERNPERAAAKRATGTPRKNKSGGSGCGCDSKQPGEEATIRGLNA